LTSGGRSWGHAARLYVAARALREIDEIEGDFGYASACASPCRNYW